MNVAKAGELQSTAVKPRTSGLSLTSGRSDSTMNLTPESSMPRRPAWTRIGRNISSRCFVCRRSTFGGHRHCGDLSRGGSLVASGAIRPARGRREHGETGRRRRAARRRAGDRARLADCDASSPAAASIGRCRCRWPFRATCWPSSPSVSSTSPGRCNRAPCCVRFFRLASRIRSTGGAIRN